MKTKRRTGLWLTVVLLLIFSMLLAVFFEPISAYIKTAVGDREISIFVATDTHLFSRNLISEDNEMYTKNRFVSDGRIQEYDYQLVEALIDEVNREKPEVLVLTGDLTFNGEKDSHLEMARLLSGVGDHTRVLVIPGNHDTYSPTPVSVLNDTMAPTESITSDDFREIYADFGYTGGLFYDEHSLSYIYEIDEGKWALMLDTTFSRYNKDGYSITAGGIETPTYEWLEDKLKYAKENGITVVSFSHHNLLVHNEMFRDGYTMGNGEAMASLFAKYGVKINMSGHLHIQSIKKTERDGETVCDISGVSLLDYGNRYGVLDIYDNCYSYESRSVNFSLGEYDVNQYAFWVFSDRYYFKTLWEYQNAMGYQDGQPATRLLADINAHYFDGNYIEIYKLMLQNPRYVWLIIENTRNYDSSYVKSILDVPPKNQHNIVIDR